MHRSLSPAALLISALMVLSVSPVLAADPSPAASATASATPASAAPAGVPLEGTTWQLTNLRLSGAYAPIPPEASATLVLRDGHAGGSGGCNAWFADYTIDGDTLTFGTIGSTLKLCEGAGGLVEVYYLADLPAVAHWAIEGDTLTLSAEDGQPVVAYTVQATPDPMGSWTVTSYADGTGTMVSVDDGSVTVVFDATSVSGTAGCNGFHGAWQLSGATLAIGPLMSTKMACEPAELMTREAAVMADLEASTALRAGTDGSIELLDATGAFRLSMSPAPAVAEPSGSPAA
jgi:heat shock protein HslJ